MSEVLASAFWASVEAISGEEGPNWRPWIALSSGLATGAYFGFRLGVVSQAARDFLSSTKYMNVVGCRNYSVNQDSRVSLFHAEAPRHLKDDEVLIEVKAGSLDFVDLKVAKGYDRGLFELVNRYNPNCDETLVILGRDGSGVVTSAGKDVYKLRPGEKVWFVVPHCFQGSLSNYIVLPEEYVKPLPRSFDFEVAATIPYTLMTAWDSLVTLGKLQPSKGGNKGLRLLICGGLRPTELMILQLAKYWGCEVTCLSPNYTHETWLSHGADHVLETSDLRQSPSWPLFDVAINTGGPLMQDTCNKLAVRRVITTLSTASSFGSSDYGAFANFLASLWSCLVRFLQPNLWATSTCLSRVKIRPEVMDYLAGVVDKDNESFRFGQIGERVYDVEHAELAARCLAAGGQQGKVVIKMKPFSKLCPISTHVRCK